MLYPNHTLSNPSRQLDLDAIYAIPDPLDTVEAYARWRHRDLLGLPRAELLAEQQRLHLRLLLDPTPAAWLQERFIKIKEALRDAD